MPITITNQKNLSANDFSSKNDFLIAQAISLLAASDWTQTADNIENRDSAWINKWKIYRKELRKVINGERDTIPEAVK